MGSGPEPGHFQYQLSYDNFFRFACLIDHIIVMRKQAFIKVKKVISVKSTAKILTQSQ